MVLCPGRLLHPHVVQFKEVFLTLQHLAIGKLHSPDQEKNIIAAPGRGRYGCCKICRPEDVVEYSR